MRGKGVSSSKGYLSYIHRRMGTLWLGGQRGWFARNFTQITAADTGLPDFLKGGGGGGGEDIPQAPPPLDIVCVTSSALRKIEKHPHSWTFASTPPWTLPVWRHPHSKGGEAIGLPLAFSGRFFLLALPEFSPLFCPNLGGQLPPCPPASYAYAYIHFLSHCCMLQVKSTARTTGRGVNE